MNERYSPFKKGDRIELIDMPDDPDPIMIGAQGIVEDCWHVDLGPRQRFWQVSVKWDNGRSLMLSVPPDRATKVST